MKTSHFAPEITDELVRTHEQYLVPAIYMQWASRVAEIAEIEFGQDILDVACGTGTLAIAAHLETGLKGKVVGLDVNEKMLAAARRHSQAIEWKLGDAASLPFEKNRFDRVMSQFSLMFISNRVATIKEMLRVCKPDGLVILAIWGPLPQASAYAELIKLIGQFCGDLAAKKLALPWDLGKPGVMDAMLLASGVNEYECFERDGFARYPSVSAFLESHLRLAGEFDALDEQAFEEILNAANLKLHAHLSAQRQVVTKLNVHVFKVRVV